MKQLTLISLILGLGLHAGLFAQSNSLQNTLTAGYFSQLGIEPGVSLGADIYVSTDLFSSSTSAQHHLVFQPQLAAFTNPENFQSALVRGGIALRRTTERKGRLRFRQLGVGLGYMFHSEITGLRVNLADGSITSKERDNRQYVVPTINASMGRMLNDRLGYYLSASYGPKLHAERKPDGAVFLELGLSYSLSPSK